MKTYEEMIQYLAEYWDTWKYKEEMVGLIIEESYGTASEKVKADIKFELELREKHKLAKLMAEFQTQNRQRQMVNLAKEKSKSNDKIKQLAATAGFDLTINGRYPTYTPLGPELEKFAELIIKECDNYVANHYDECEPWMEPGDLSKHFGIG